MLLLHGNNRYHVKEHEYQGTDIAAENTYRAELGLHLYGRSWQETTTGAQLLDWKTIVSYYSGTTIAIENNGYDITISAKIAEAGTETSRQYIDAKTPLPDTFAGKTISWSYTTWENNVPQEDAKLDWQYSIDGKTYYRKAQTITIPENATDIFLRFFLIENASSTVPVGTYTVKFTGVMLNYGDTALPWEPYTGGMPSPNPDYPQPINSIGDSGSVDVVVTGKNLIPTNLAQVGISYNADTKHWKFEALSKYGLVNVRIIDPNKGSCILPTGQYTFTTIDSQNMLHVTISDIGNGWKTLATVKKTKTSVTFTLTKDTEIGIYVVPEDITQPGYVQIQLERGATATSYQPYREPQTLTINTPNGLCGIPVDTGGNYTDSTGQQWVCDEVDFERGVFVQRIKKSTVKTLDRLQETGEQGRYADWFLFSGYASAEVKSIIAIASYFAWGAPQPLKWIGAVNLGGLYISPPKNTDYTVDTLKSYLTPLLPFEVCGVLATPIETPLTAAELAAYKAIKSYPHYTHIESAAELRVKLKEY